MFRHLKKNCSIILKERLYSTNARLKYDHGYDRRIKRKTNEYRQFIQVLKTREDQLRIQEVSDKKSFKLEENNIENLSNEILKNETEEDDDFKLIPKLNKMIQIVKRQNDDDNLNRFNTVTENFNREINAYIDACLSNTSLINESFDAIKLLSTKSQKSKHKKLADVEIFNKIYFYLATRKKTNDIGYYFKLMRSNNIQPNIHSYAACLLSINPNYYKSKFIVARVLNDISNANFNLNDLISSQRYTKTQLDEIVNIIRLVLPQFELKNDLNDKCTNELLKNLNSYSEISQFKGELPLKLDEIYKKFEQQLDIEQKTCFNVPSIYNIGKNDQYKEELRQELNKTFRDQLTKALETQLQLIEKSKKFNDSLIFPILKSIPLHLLVDLLEQQLHTLFISSQYHSENLIYLSFILGKRVETLFNLNRFGINGGIGKIKKVHKEYLNKLFNSSIDNANNDKTQRELWLEIAHKNDLNLEDLSTQWPYRTRIKIGKYLFDILLNNLKFDVNKIQIKKDANNNNNNKIINVLYRIYRVEGIYKDLEIKVAPQISHLYSSVNYFKFNSSYLPMLTVPVPWCTPKIGGFLLTVSNLLRIEVSNLNQTEQYNRINKSKPSDMYPVYDSLNVLSSCPWKINTRILDLMIKIFNNKGSKELDIPQPESEGPEVPVLTIDKEKLPKSEYIKRVKARNEARKIRAEMHSLWCSELYKLSIANKYRNDILWFPHSLDFRGRSYPIPPYFNHLGNDISRSLMLFAELKPLGPNGLDTLKLHCINLTGTMKRASIKDRIEYANSIIDDIVDSADRPLDGRLWWQKSEEPWQTLACCIEITNAIRSGNPNEYKSGYPIHQDGSCNGLQHYAALGRDELGASSVNLAKSDIPRDVYSDVVDRVELERKRDAQEGNIEIAKTLDGLIKRKVIKQTIMTTVYNVTPYGAKLQIQRQLVDLPVFFQNKQLLEEASKYLVIKTFKCLGEMFNSASKIQQWLSQCAYYISRIRNTPIEWNTPLGLSVIQPYFKEDDKTKIKKPNYNKQRAAFPPNFVHSLDSCHMMLTSLYCEHSKLRFVSVHDCYWTHACDINIMNKICREQFIALHSLPILENLSKSFSVYKFSNDEIQAQNNVEVQRAMIKFNRILDDVPKKGKFDLNNVQESIYFFS